jgi:long-chain acyl-CoA synthetase
MKFPKPLNQPTSQVIGHFGSLGDWRETDLAAAVSRLIRWLAQKELMRNELVAIAVSGPKETWATHLALMHLGIPIMPMAHDMPRKRANALLDSAKPQLLLKSADVAFGDIFNRVEEIPIFSQKKSNLMSKLLAKKKKTEAPSHPVMALPFDWPDHLAVESKDEQVAYVMFTSGSTAMPKGVQLTFGNLRHHFQTLQNVYAIQPEDRLLNNLSLSHVDGLLQGPLLAHFCEATWLRPFDSLGVHNMGEFLDEPYATQATHIFVAPMLLELLAGLESASSAFDYLEVRMLISSSAMLDKKRWEKFESIFQCPILNVYGMTETVAGSLFAGPSDDTRVGGTVGRPMDCTIRVVSENGNDVEPGERGELWIRGLHTTPGYWKRPDLTEQLYPEQGWLATGDIASIRKDGLVELVGRKKSGINVAGFLVHPEEVEEALKDLDGIRDAHCLGVSDNRGEERVGAAVILDPEHPWNSLTEAELLAAIAESTQHQLEVYKRPSSVQVWPVLPIGPSGKVEQTKAKSSWESHKTVQKLSGDDVSLEDQILNLAQVAFKNNAVQMGSDSTNTNGWDSMAHLDFIVAVERTFGIRFTTAEMMKANAISIALEITQNHLTQR